MWNLSSWTRNQTHVLCIARCILNHWTTREFAHRDILWSVPCLDHFWQSFLPLLNSMPPKSLEGPRQGLYIPVLGKVLLVLYSTPCITMHRGRMWYTLLIMCVDRHTPEQKIWTSVSALSQHLRKLDLPTCQSHQNFTCLVDHMLLSHMSLFSHWEFYIKTVNK